MWSTATTVAYLAPSCDKVLYLHQLPSPVHCQQSCCDPLPLTFLHAVYILIGDLPDKSAARCVCNSTLNGVRFSLAIERSHVGELCLIRRCASSVVVLQHKHCLTAMPSRVMSSTVQVALCGVSAQSGLTDVAMHLRYQLLKHVDLRTVSILAPALMSPQGV